MAAKPTFALTLPSTVVVTGASSGLGHELSRLLLQSGVETIGVDRAPALDELRENNRYAHVSGGVSDETTWEAVNALLDKSGTRSLGLVTSKTGRLESRAEIKKRIEEATKYVALDQLCLSPQCGFASTEEGNVLAEDEQWAKLRMIVELADEVWGK